MLGSVADTVAPKVTVLEVSIDCWLHQAQLLSHKSTRFGDWTVEYLVPEDNLESMSFVGCLATFINTWREFSVTSSLD